MININSWIIPIFTTIMGAVITVIANHFLSSYNEKNKMKNKTINTKANLKVEFELNKKKIEQYNEQYLKLNISTIILLNQDKNDIYLDFYKNLSSFPIFNHTAWNNAQNIINNIFNEQEIKKMIEFNTSCDELKEKSNNLHEKYVNKNFKEENNSYSDIRDFEWDIRNTINKGEIVLVYFNF